MSEQQEVIKNDNNPSLECLSLSWFAYSCHVSEKTIRYVAISPSLRNNQCHEMKKCNDTIIVAKTREQSSSLGKGGWDQQKL